MKMSTVNADRERPVIWNQINWRIEKLYEKKIVSVMSVIQIVQKKIFRKYSESKIHAIISNKEIYCVQMKILQSLCMWQKPKTKTKETLKHEKNKVVRTHIRSSLILKDYGVSFTAAYYYYCNFTIWYAAQSARA